MSPTMELSAVSSDPEGGGEAPRALREACSTFQGPLVKPHGSVGTPTCKIPLRGGDNPPPLTKREPSNPPERRPPTTPGGFTLLRRDRHQPDRAEVAAK